ncbi:MAG TPA: HD domain-containing protein [Candidatus Saccharimonadales bacterium]|nr:HD domain-containing protein [Candidatus Saccharimonadales bacterium]
MNNENNPSKGATTPENIIAQAYHNETSTETKTTGPLEERHTAPLYNVELEVIPSSMTVRELRHKLQIDIDPDETDGKYHVPFTRQLLTYAFAGEKTKEEIREMYIQLIPHWWNFSRVDHGVTDKSGIKRADIKMVKHAERSAAIGFEMSILYSTLQEKLKTLKEKSITETEYNKVSDALLLNELLSDTSSQFLDDIELDKETIKEVSKIALQLLLHDIGKGKKENGKFKHREYLMSHDGLTDEQFKTMQEHSQDGVDILEQIVSTDKKRLFDNAFINTISDHQNIFTANKSLADELGPIVDGLDAATHRRSYSDGEPLESFLILKDTLGMYAINDKRLNAQFDKSGNHLLKYVTYRWIRYMVLYGGQRIHTTSY